MALPELKTGGQQLNLTGKLAQMMEMKESAARMKLSDFMYEEKKREAEQERGFLEELAAADWQPGSGVEGLSGLYNKYPEQTKELISQERELGQFEINKKAATLQEQQAIQQKIGFMNQLTTDAFGVIDPASPDAPDRYRIMRKEVKGQLEEMLGEGGKKYLTESFDQQFPEEYDEKAALVVTNKRLEMFKGKPPGSELKEVKTKDSQGRDVIETFLVRADGSMRKIASASRFSPEQMDVAGGSRGGLGSIKSPSDALKRISDIEKTRATIGRMTAQEALIAGLLSKEQAKGLDLGAKIPEHLLKPMNAAMEREIRYLNETFLGSVGQPGGGEGGGSGQEEEGYIFDESGGFTWGPIPKGVTPKGQKSNVQGVPQG